MPVGITLRETRNRASTGSGSHSSTYLVEEIFDGYMSTSDLPILLPRDDGETSRRISIDDGTSSMTDHQVHEQELETNLKIDRAKTEMRELRFHDLEAFECDGTPFDFKSLKGKYVVIINIAQRCGHEWHMEFLQELSDKYRNDVVVLGFPSNSFLLNWKSAKDTRAWFKKRYQCTFKIMEKVKVNGSEQHKVFRFLKEHSRGTLGVKTIAWNFEKFLIDRDGLVVKRYSTFKHPRGIMGDLDDLLKNEESRTEVSQVKRMGSSHKLRQLVSPGKRVIYV